MSLISDGELRRELKERGVDVGPITDATRSLYQRKLISLKKSGAGKNPGRGHVKSPANSSGYKRQRSTSNACDGSSEPSKKRTRVSPAKPAGIEKSEADSPKQRLYPDLSPLVLKNAEVVPNSSSKVVSSSKFAEASSSSKFLPNKPNLQQPSKPKFQLPKPKHNSQQLMPKLNMPKLNSQQLPRPKPNSQQLPKPKPKSQKESPLGKNLRVQPSLPASSSSSSSLTDESMLCSSDLPSPEDSSSSVFLEAGSPENPALSPQHGKEKGLMKVVTDFFESGVSRLLNVSGSFGSPRKKLSDVRKQDQNPPLHLQHHEVVDLSVGRAANRTDGNLLASGGASKKYDWELEASDVILCKRKDGQLWRLGKGGFGEVFKGVKDSIDEVAVKKIPIEHYHRSAIEQFKQEIDMISKLRHRHIVQFYGACIQPQNCYMVTELMDSDLFSIMRLPREAARYKWSGLYGKEVLVGVASGLNYLHSRKPPVVHRDIKSPNILVVGSLAKIADVGIARTMGTSDMTAQKGYSLAWAAPEVVYRRRATEKIDIWSIGVIIWEVVTGGLPKPGKLDMPIGTPTHLTRLYLRCINDDPSARPSALEVTAELKGV